MSNQPNVAFSLLVIHKVVTRGLQVALENAERFRDGGFPDATTQSGYFNYVRALVSVLHSHHITEDDLIFPYFKDKLPEMPVATLTAQHQEMIPILDELQALLPQQEAAGRVGLEVSRALAALNGMWLPHIAIEEQHLTVQRLGEMLPVEEHLRLVQAASKHSQDHSGPPFLVLPFILYNLQTEMREEMEKSMPAEVTGHLVPVVWKDQWASMKSFLLQ